MARVNMNADGKQADGQEFPVADPGKYLVRVEKKTDGLTGESAKNPNCQKVDLLFSLWDMDNKVGSCWHTLTFIPEGRPGHGMWLHANKALGMPWDGALDYDTDEYVNASCYAEVKIDTYQGKKRNKIAAFLLPETEEGDAQEPVATEEPAPGVAPSADAMDECPV